GGCRGHAVAPDGVHIYAVCCIITWSENDMLRAPVVKTPRPAGGFRPAFPYRDGQRHPEEVGHGVDLSRGVRRGPEVPRGECGEAARGVNRGETMSLAKELRLVRTGACYAKFLRLLQKSTDPSDASLDLIPV